MSPDAHDAARIVHRLIERTTSAGLSSGGTRTGPRAWAQAAHPVAGGALRLVVPCLAASGVAEHRALAAAVTRALDARDHATALDIVSNARRRPDLRAEKILSRRYGFVWTCLA